MRWKTLGLFIATIAFSMSAFCTGLAAQNEPFLGIWQINLENTSNYAQQTQMIINVPAPGGFTSIRATGGKDGKSSTEVHPVAFDAKHYMTTGGFDAVFPSGVAAQVGAEHRDGLATRKCQGTLLWDKQKLGVAATAAEVDVDALGIDLGLGTPVVTFQAKKVESECCMTLQIYSLQRPPKLLRTITGGSFFSTADTDLDGQIEIWTNDAAVMEGFESPNVGRPDFAPTVVLRFVHGRLLDVSAEFAGYFDGEIARARGELDPEALREFKESSGRLPPTAYFSQGDLRHSRNLQPTQVSLLQIILAYLYSGRKAEAWKSLAEMWPAADLERIPGALSSVRARGILSQTDGTSAATQPHSGVAKVFDLRTHAPPMTDIPWGKSMRT